MPFLQSVDEATEERAFRELTPEEYTLYSFIRFRAGRGEMRWCQEKIAAALNMPLRTLQRAATGALTKKWIATKRTGKASIYWLPDPPIWRNTARDDPPNRRNRSAILADGSETESLYTKRKETQNTSAFKAKIAAIDREGDVIVITPKHASLYGALYGDITERRLLAQQYGVSRCEVHGGSWENHHSAASRCKPPAAATA